ncbi:MAG: glycoside hydrolase family 97 catalytic domain-containing protein [Prevotellaceae bacterium]|jgi:alpha-glucosidase|nr:glycoside hydrolase family 97 catalytic domain-containing protein [Prevotellaceae bacterium]
MNMPLRKPIFLLLLALALAGSAAAAAEYSVTSPNGRLRVALTSADGDKTTYSVQQKSGAGWRTLISPSEVSMTIKDGGVWGKDATVSAVAYDTATAVAPRAIPLIYGKTASLVESYREVRVDFAQGYSLAVRAYNEGAAYRFISRAANGDTTYVASENASFTFAEAVTVWYPAMSDLDKMGDDENYERWYTKFGSIADIRSDYDAANGNDFRYSVTPVLFGFDGGSGVKVAITEADLHSYPTLYLQRESNSSMKGFWTYYPKTQTAGDQYTGPKILTYEDYLAQNTGAHSYPWRVIIVAEEDKDLLANQLVLLLSSPQKEGVDFAFVRDAPGKSTWEYWHDARLEVSGLPSGWGNISNGNGPGIYKHYIDFAKEYGFRYITIDTDGQHNLTGSEQRTIVSYGKDSGVQVVKWDYIADVMYNKNRLNGLKNIGYTCVKVDFFYRTDQQGTEVVEQLADAAAKLGLTLLLHGCPVPHGLHRTYPNILSYEAVAGAENYKWDEKRAGGRLPTAKYHVEIPFIRQLAGPMDYTPGSLRNVHYAAYSPTWSGIPKSIGTRAHELAMYVMYDMPIAYLCDNPKTYRDNPAVMKYLAKVPTVWDESVALDGKVGEYAMIAKRKGKAWFVAGMTNESERTFDVSRIASLLGSIADSEKYRVILYRDNRPRSDATATAMAVDSALTISALAELGNISCSPEGGFVMQAFVEGSDDDPDKKADDDEPTGVEKKSSGEALHAYAYASANASLLTVKSSDLIRAVAIVNMQGTVVEQRKYSGISTQEELAIAHLPAGIYIVSVEATSGACSFKFLK